jgi:hypothetical protein
MIFHQIMHDDRLNKYCAGPEEMHVIFYDAYRDLVA